MKKYYRVVNTRFERAGVHTSDEFEAPNRTRYEEVLPILKLVTRFSLIFRAPIHILLHPIVMFYDRPDVFSLAINLDVAWKEYYCREFFKLSPLSNPFTHLDCSLIWQYLWDKVRASKFPELPPRQRAVMLWRCREEAEKFMQSERAGFDDIGIVEVLIPDSIEPQAYDMSWLDEVPTSASAEEAMRYANRYWRQESSAHPVWEVLYYGEYEIVTR